MRRIVTADVPATSKLLASALLTLCAAGPGLLADEPLSPSTVDEPPKSGVVIRLQLQPSSPSNPTESNVAQELPVVVGGPKEATQTEATQTEDSPLKIPAETVQYRMRLRRERSTTIDSKRTAKPAVQAPRRLDSESRATMDSKRSAKPAVQAPRGLDSESRATMETESTPTQSIIELESQQELSSEDVPPHRADGTQLLTLELESSHKTPSNEPVADQSNDKQQANDFSNELRLEGDCGDESAGSALLELQLDDIPLQLDEHPYDAPTAETTPQSSQRNVGPRGRSRDESSRDTAPSDSLAPVLTPSQLGEPAFTQRQLQLDGAITRCLDYYRTHPENTTRRGPWALMHATLPLGVQGEVMAGNRRVNIIGWLSFNGTCGKQNMFQSTRSGFRPNVGPGVQGHDGQFLAILAQSNVRSDYPLQINRQQYTVMDLARYEMATCREKSELTFKLIGLSRYLEPNHRWRDNRGHNWTLEKILADEMSQPVNGAACGGTHRLMGLSFALIERQAAGQPVTGQWRKAQEYLNDYVKYTLTLQNPDGSFSSNWFETRGMDPNVERRVQTTGHMLEWLVYTLPDEHLGSPQIERGVQFLLDTVGREPERDWPIGPRSHALRALALYQQRLFNAQDSSAESFVAERPQQTVNSSRR